MNMIGQIESNARRFEVMTAIARAHAKAGHATAARDALLRAGQFLETDLDAATRARLKASFVNDLVAQDLLNEAVAVARSIDQLTEADQALEHVAAALVRADRVADAMTLVKQISDPSRRSQTLVQLIQVLMSEDKIEEALQLAEQPSAEPAHQESLLELTVQLHLKRGDPEQAVAALARLTGAGPRERATRVLASHLAQADQVESAADWLRLDRSPPERASLLLGLAEGLLQPQEESTDTDDEPQDEKPAAAS